MSFTPENYPYFYGDLVHLNVALILFVFLASQRRQMILSGLMVVPFAFIATLSEGVYWVPQRVFSIASIGIEDVLFCFTFGVLAWGFGALGNLPVPALQPFSKRFFIYAGLIGISGSMLLAILIWMGIGIGPALPLTQVIVGSIILFLRPSLIGTCLRSSVFLTVYYTIMLVVSSQWIGDAAVAMWNHNTNLGLLIAEIPVEEYLFAPAFAMSWVAILAYCSESDEMVDRGIS